MYKIFEVTYNDGGWHYGDLPSFLYIAMSKEEVIANSKKYQEFLKRQAERGGSVWIREATGLASDLSFENLSEFDVSVSVRKKY